MFVCGLVRVRVHVLEAGSRPSPLAGLVNMLHLAVSPEAHGGAVELYCLKVKDLQGREGPAKGGQGTVAVRSLRLLTASIHRQTYR